MQKHTLFLCAVMVFSLSLHAQNSTTYYKCVTKNGTIFSQFPCKVNATAYTINTVSGINTAPAHDYTKELNALERERIVLDLQAELRSNNNKLAIIKRKKDRAEYNQQQRLNRILDDEDKKLISKDITKQLKIINKEHKKQTTEIEKRIKKLEKKIASFQ
ncbi:hypothetical protein CWC17_18645 [Pseudoalteromonas sp. S3785]|uniref:DUF4124 domain-containing protein n=1 Tax=Pseudoalteromonas sp. S3785 TaxID=579545 RepID=UPI00110BEF3E|nr:DUF4124 domain-containing protein [Pseudoalteromonas sp. S3785]TMO70336.1 hypothetical protein CWC17_18645 [Pseudoalteromonas sp. S3785]